MKRNFVRGKNCNSWRTVFFFLLLRSWRTIWIWITAKSKLNKGKQERNVWWRGQNKDKETKFEFTFSSDPNENFLNFLFLAVKISINSYTRLKLLFKSMIFLVNHRKLEFKSMIFWWSRSKWQDRKVYACTVCFLFYYTKFFKKIQKKEKGVM